jgi:predicted SprT family Zn-dependent metalloprotease
VANQLITEGMKERKHFERTLSKFNRLIERAARSYLDRNSININPYRLKGQGARKLITQGQVCNRYCD